MKSKVILKEWFKNWPEAGKHFREHKKQKYLFKCPEFVHSYLLKVYYLHNLEEVEEIFGHDIELIYRLNLVEAFESLMAFKVEYEVLRAFLDEQKEKDHQISGRSPGP